MDDSTIDTITELLTLTQQTVNGTVKFYNQEGKLHRVHGPAVIWGNGTQEWYYNGQLHREDGPAVEKSNINYWYRRGMLHRLGGPAIQGLDVVSEYWVNGRRLRTAD